MSKKIITVTINGGDKSFQAIQKVLRKEFDIISIDGQILTLKPKAAHDPKFWIDWEGCKRTY